MISRQIIEDNCKNGIRVKHFEDTLHDVKTPISIIHLLAQNLVEAENMPENLKDYAASIKKHSDKIIDLLNEINNPDRVLGNSFKPRLINYDIVNLTENIVHATIDLALRKNISVTFDTNVEEKIIAIDKALFYRIIVNLISNAIKFTPEYGYVDIMLTDRIYKITIDVIDNGTGFGELETSRIFERYQTKNTEDNRNGVGIGLAIVKEMVDALGGQIEATSCEDHIGATFSLTLPVIILNEYDSSEILDFYQTRIT